MRREFLENIEEYSQLIKKGKGLKTESGDDEFEAELNKAINKASKKRGSDFLSQRQIYLIQKEKQKTMNQLRRQLVNLDNPEHHSKLGKNSRLVNQEQGRYYDQYGTEISLGDLFIDQEWNIHYILDDQTMPRKIRKRFLIERAKYNLQKYLDQQIIVDETTSKYTHWKKQSAYSEIQYRNKEGIEQFGLIAEKMVRNFLRKLSIDFPKLNFEVIKADVFQDVEQKIDFIIQRRPHSIGVNVQAVDAEGIQFTTNTAQPNLEKKKEQIEHSKLQLSSEDLVKNIVIVSLPVKTFIPVYDEWLKTKSSGGPDKLWSIEVKETIFRELLKGFMSPEEIAQQWGVVSEKLGSYKMAA